MAVKRLLKTSTAAGAALCVLGQPALAELKYENNSGGYVEIYGQFNPAIISVDDGEQTETNLLDNDLSRSRVGLRLIQPIGANTFGFRFETGLGFPNSTEVNQFGSDYSGWTRADLRHVDFWLEGGWGKFSAGQGSMVADGAAETDLSYVGTALYSYPADANAGFLFRDTAGALSGPAVASAFDNLDGSRRGRIRYDTPDLNGFSAGIAWGQNILSSGDDADYYDIGLRYGQEFGSTNFAASLAYQVRDDAGDERSDVIGSASVLLDSGISFTVAGGSRDNDAAGASDPSYYYAKIGYETDNWLPWGKTGLGVHYYDGEDFNVTGSSAKGWGVGVAQKVDSINTDIYLTYQEYEYEDAAATYQDLTTWVLGARWRF
ncbi:porin [Leisingera aquaemixtae]|uniref:porin n=1 Tax=Leisingera TaxID=191028 RepID=UPI001C97A803|nr:MULTISPECIES: porin [Leisingera]MBY6065824.1 porin [Leisingera aquaemixtae]MCB4455566.1 porin [Leisingera sp. McT4-56]